MQAVIEIVLFPVVFIAAMYLVTLALSPISRTAKDMHGYFFSRGNSQRLSESKNR